MKTLTLLRHAKSGWDDPALPDIDRPLNAKGRRAAATMGRYLRGQQLLFDHVVASPALRVRETLDAVRQGYGRRFDPDWDRRLYLASCETLLEIVAGLPEGARRVLLVGHNPGLEELVLALVPCCTDLRDAVALKYPTASLAEIGLGERWTDAIAGGAALNRFVRPRDLDPTLGPDEV